MYTCILERVWEEPNWHNILYNNCHEIGPQGIVSCEMGRCFIWLNQSIKFSRPPPTNCEISPHRSEAGAAYRRFEMMHQRKALCHPPRAARPAGWQLIREGELRTVSDCHLIWLGSVNICNTIPVADGKQLISLSDYEKNEQFSPVPLCKPVSCEKILQFCNSINPFFSVHACGKIVRISVKIAPTCRPILR